MNDTSRIIVAFQTLSTDALRDVRARALGSSPSTVAACDYLLRQRNSGHQRIADADSGTLRPYDASIRDQFGNITRNQVGFTGDPIAWMRPFMSGATVTRIDTSELRVSTDLAPGEKVIAADGSVRLTGPRRREI